MSRVLIVRMVLRRAQTSFTRRPVFCALSATVKASEGQGPRAGSEGTNSTVTPAAWRHVVVSNDAAIQLNVPIRISSFVWVPDRERYSEAFDT